MRKAILTLLVAVLLICIPIDPSLGQAVLKHEFSDVKEGDWFYSSVSKLTKEGYLSGYSDNTFKPQNKIKVSEFIKILMRVLGYELKEPEKGYWATNYINKAKEIGIILDKEFDDYERYITRGEIARMIVRAGEKLKDEKLALNIPDDYKEYSYLITDYSTIDSHLKDYALKIYTSGIMGGFSNGNIGFEKNTTRAEVCETMLRFLNKDKRVVPALPFDFSDTLTVKEFTLMLLEKIGQKGTMEHALEKGYVRYPSEYPTYEKPILRREAALTVARVMDDITDLEGLFTNGKNDYFLEGYTLNHRLQPDQIGMLINEYGLRNNTHEKYFALVYWHNYIGNIKDIRMITEEYLKEMTTLYLAGILDSDNEGKLRPYDFLTKEEAEEIINRVKRYDAKDSKKAIEQLALYIRDVDMKPIDKYLDSTAIKIIYHTNLDKNLMADYKVEEPSNSNLWWTTYPSVNKRLYEYDISTTYDFSSNSELKYGEKLDPINNAFIHLNDFKNYVRIAKNYMNARYNIDYRSLDSLAPYGGPLDINGSTEGKLVDYKTRVLYFFNPQDVLNGIKDENDKVKDESTWILPDIMIDKEIEKYKKHKIVSQAEFVTHDSLMYWGFGSGYIRGTLRIIFYPPTDPNYLKERGLEVGEWYEKDVEVLFSNMVLSSYADKYRDRWTYSLLFYIGTKDLEANKLIESRELLDYKTFRPMEQLDI